MYDGAWICFDIGKITFSQWNLQREAEPRLLLAGAGLGDRY